MSMTPEQAELVRSLRDLAAGKHDDLSVAADASGVIQALASQLARMREQRDEWQEVSWLLADKLAEIVK